MVALNAFRVVARWSPGVPLFAKAMHSFTGGTTGPHFVSRSSQKSSPPKREG